MAQILDPLPSDNQLHILCCYVNVTSQIQVARITNIPNWYFERVVFPGQRLVFEALPAALLEIHTGMMASAILSDTIPCTRLCVDEGENGSVEPAPESVLLSSDNKPAVETVNYKNRVTAESIPAAEFVIEATDNKRTVETADRKSRLTAEPLAVATVS
ncbi:MAG TPA: hypothetical protein DDZ80_26125 [Cyanobacteria bacterium UBA8803]|nr:hypothetical protein [Cyanobacteria bacterium UBA9273]HBL61764.1 hypothetical protein [Cyanobacteria bacterium UBA8803]